mmetsp:Transcript_111945/g.209927  ORF Transcript_111945/g.209927 Transcript_111945/m.209927 type:complete len:332 (+) Transcript_111945:81-1076(+)
MESKFTWICIVCIMRICMSSMTAMEECAAKEGTMALLQRNRKMNKFQGSLSADQSPDSMPTEQSTSSHLDADGQLDNDSRLGEASKIPWQLVLTGKQDSLEQLPELLLRNVNKTMALNPGMRVRYLSDSQCKTYVQKHSDNELSLILAAEPFGAYRGDLCRAVVLLHEGGFYADLDLEPLLPFKSMVDESTTFMSAFGVNNEEILNALMAVEPDSVVMNETLQQIRKWYNGTRGWHMGPVAVKQAVQSVIQTSCPEVDLDAKRQTAELQWQCGLQSFRFFHELLCSSNGTMQCPPERSHTALKYGIFSKDNLKNLVAWSRAGDCAEYNCGG